MRLLRDCFGHTIRLTDERLSHIFAHPEMSNKAMEIQQILSQPLLVRRSRTDMAVRLFYGFYTNTLVGSKWLCVVVKYINEDAFVVTACLTDQPKAGEELW